MKFARFIFLISFILVSSTLLANDPPTVNIVSDDVVFCENGTAILSLEFTGDKPFAFAYQIGNDTYWEGTMDLSPTQGNHTINAYTYEMNLPLDSSNDIIVIRLYDSNNQYEPDNKLSSGVEVINQSMSVLIDQMPTPYAGADDEICGYEYTLNGTNTDVNYESIWSVTPLLGSFDDATSSSAKYTASADGNYIFTLSEVNGECTATDDVEIHFFGNPTATINSSSIFKFCSSDEVLDSVEIEINFTGNAPFNYSIKNSDDTFVSEENVDGLVDILSYQVLTSDVYTMWSLVDVNNCSAEDESMEGAKIVIDLKPDVNPGDDKVACGTEFTLEAELISENTGVWTTSTNGVTIEDVNLANSLATLSSEALYQNVTFNWEVTEPVLSCKNSDEVTITYVEYPSFSIAVDNDQICEGSSSFMDYTLTGNYPWELTFNNGSTTIVNADITEASDNLELIPNFDTSNYLQSITDYDFQIVKDKFGCESIINVVYSVAVDEMALANAGEIDEAVCGLDLELSAQATIVEGLWSGPGEFILDDDGGENAVFIASDFGENTIKWSVENGSCSDFDERMVTFKKMPYPIDAGHDTIIYATDNIALYAMPLIEGVGLWTLLEGTANIVSQGDFNSVVTEMESGTYRFLWTTSIDDLQCPEEELDDEVVVVIEDLFAATGFSPNGDQLNETFQILGAANKISNKLIVFNRYGEVVYSCENYENDWRGTREDGSDLPQGTYYFVFEAEGLSQPIKKYLIIKR